MVEGAGLSANLWDKERIARPELTSGLGWPCHPSEHSEIADPLLSQ